MQNCTTNLASSSSPSCSQARVERSRGWSQIFFNTFNSANGDRVLINNWNKSRTFKFLRSIFIFCLTSIIVSTYMKYREVLDNYLPSQVRDKYRDKAQEFFLYVCNACRKLQILINYCRVRTLCKGTCLSYSHSQLGADRQQFQLMQKELNLTPPPPPPLTQIQILSSDENLTLSVFRIY